MAMTTKDKVTVAVGGTLAGALAAGLAAMIGKKKNGSTMSGGKKAPAPKKGCGGCGR